MTLFDQSGQIRQRPHLLHTLPLPHHHRHGEPCGNAVDPAVPAIGVRQIGHQPILLQTPGLLCHIGQDSLFYVRVHIQAVQQKQIGPFPRHELGVEGTDHILCGGTQLLVQQNLEVDPHRGVASLELSNGLANGVAVPEPEDHQFGVRKGRGIRIIGIVQQPNVILPLQQGVEAALPVGGQAR